MATLAQNFHNQILSTTIGIIPRIPTQLIEAGCYLILFIFLFWGYWKKKWHERQGLLFGIFLAFLFGARFIIEFFKEHQTLQDESLLNMGQWLSIPAIIIGLVFIIIAIKKPKKAFNNGATSIVVGRSITRGNIKKNIQKIIKSLK